MDRLITGFTFLVLGGLASIAAGQLASLALPLGVASIVLNLVGCYHFLRFIFRGDSA